MTPQQNVTDLLLDQIQGNDEPRPEGSGELARLVADWPDWHVWRGLKDDGSPGSWFATRRRYLTRAEERAFRLFPTVDADQPVQLAARLREQAVREAANERA